MSRTFYVPAGSADKANKARNEAIAYLMRVSADVSWEVSIREHKAKRSVDQNALLWALYADVIEKGGEAMAGWEGEDLHELFLGEHYGWVALGGMSRPRLKPIRRSSNMSKAEFSEHVEYIVRYMARHGVVLELPGDPM